MSDVLTADSDLYEDLYDVRREAEDAGNLVEEDMNPAMNALRDKAPVQKGALRELLGLPPHHRHPMTRDMQAYTCFDFATCNEAFRDEERFTNVTYKMFPGEEPGLSILEMDGQEHRAFRAVIQPMFIKPQTLTWWRNRWVNEIVTALVEHLHKSDRAELNLELCARVPVHTITRAIGLHGDESLRFRHGLNTMLSQSAPIEQKMEATNTVEQVLLDLIARRRAEPQDDVTSHLIAGTLDLDGEQRPLKDREIMLMLRVIMIAGGGTSWRQFGLTLWGLLMTRQWEDLKADRSLAERAIDESLRWNATDPVFTRYVDHDCELGGVPMKGGDALEICLGAANRDPSRWDNPDVYDMHRPKKTHLGFGIGKHQCLGMNVAHSEINVGLNMLMDHFPNMRLDPDAPATVLTGGLEQRGVSALHVLLK